MALGRRSPKEPELFISHHALAESPGHPFYRKLNAVLAEAGFDHWVEKLCAESYADGVGRPGIPPGVYFRMLFVGYFEGLGSDRAIAWRCADSLSLREFLGLSLSERTPEHSSMTRIRQRLTKEIHEKVFVFILGMLEKKGLVKGRRVAIDATTIEANAAMRHIERRDDGRSYNEYLSDLAREAGIEEPTKADRVKVDRKRKKTCSNKEWRPTHDPDARITKMKDGRTRAAYKPEHVVDLETQALLATEVQPADASDTATMVETLRKAQAALVELDEDEPVLIEEVVADKGYHKTEVLKELTDDWQARTYVPERGWPKRRRWGKNSERSRRAVYLNRRRVRRPHGRRLQRQRGEVVERSFAHVCDTGGLRRMTLRGRETVSKRYVIYGAAFNLGLLMRKLVGAGSPRGLASSVAATLRAALAAFLALLALLSGRSLTTKDHQRTRTP
jgi:transposase